jgi:hypothetical protein
MRDPIPPALARSPAEAAELVCLAVSDGDLEAALAQYELGGVLRPWATSLDGVAPGSSLTAHAIARELTALMEFRLPLALHVTAVVAGSGLALVLAERQLRGTAPDGDLVNLAGSGSTVVLRGPDGSWRIAADAWCLTGLGEPQPG